MSDPVVIGPNQPADRFYRGGPRIAAFRGLPASGNRVPEDWVGSATTLAGDSSMGLTLLPDGVTLRDAIFADPVGWLGAEHVARFGADPMLLVKLLDAGQRLPVHAHPDGDFAGTHLGRSHGKAEAWYLLESGVVHLGLIREVGAGELADLVASQDTATLLGLLHRIEVATGDTVFVPAGTLHAIGAGLLLAEVQEPEDLSILLEWRDFALDGVRDGHLGLGFPLALSAVDRTGRSADEVAAWVTHGMTGSTLTSEADRYFRLDHLVVDGTADAAPGFAIAIGIAGELEVSGTGIRIQRGTTVILPAAAGELRLRGQGEVLICRPPDPRS